MYVWCKLDQWMGIRANSDKMESVAFFLFFVLAHTHTLTYYYVSVDCLLNEKKKSQGNATQKPNILTDNPNHFGFFFLNYLSKETKFPKRVHHIHTFETCRSLYAQLKMLLEDTPQLNELSEMPLPTTPLDLLRLIWRKYHHSHTNHRQNSWRLWIC